MFSRKTTSFAISLLAATALFAATPLRDSIPRERLISNAEFFRALDLQRKGFASVRTLLAIGDTSRALQAVALYFRTRSTPRYFFTTSEFQKRLEQFKNKLLGLTAQGYAAVVCCALGYRSAGDKYAAAPKVRFPTAELVKTI